MAREKGEVVPVAVQISGKTKAIMAILAAVVLLSVCGIGGFLYWNSLPPQQFENWPRTYSSSVALEGATLYVDEIGRNENGSGYIKYTLGNYQRDDEYGKAETVYYGPDEPWVEYEYDSDIGKSFYQIYPPVDRVKTMDAKGASSLEPGEEIQLVEILPENTLPISGVYRFCVEKAGSVTFVVMDDGTAVADNETGIRFRKAYEETSAQ